VGNVINYKEDFRAFNYAALKHFMYIREKLQRAYFRVFDVFGPVVSEDRISQFINEQYGIWSPGEEDNLEEQLEQYDEEINLQNKKFYKDVAGLDTKDGPVDESLKKFFEFDKTHASNAGENDFILNGSHMVAAERTTKEI